jgi:hypothetical protein
MSLAVGRNSSLWDALSLVPDHQRSEGKRYPFAGLLLIAIAAFLSGCKMDLPGKVAEKHSYLFVHWQK